MNKNSKNLSEVLLGQVRLSQFHFSVWFYNIRYTFAFELKFRKSVLEDHVAPIGDSTRLEWRLTQQFRFLSHKTAFGIFTASKKHFLLSR